MGKNFTFLLALACLFLSSPLLAQSPEAFKLTGSNYIVGQDPIDASGEFTVEFWAYIPYSSYDGNSHQIIAGRSGHFCGLTEQSIQQHGEARIGDEIPKDSVARRLRPGGEHIERHFSTKNSAEPAIAHLYGHAVGYEGTPMIPGVATPTGNGSTHSHAMPTLRLIMPWSVSLVT